MQGPIEPGDWFCPVCRDLQFARNPLCKKCGTGKPGEVNSEALALVCTAKADVSRPILPGDWNCILCQTINFGTRHTCAKCNTKKPFGGALHEEITNMQQQFGSAATGSVVGYVAPGTINSVSGWAKQWESGPVNGMLVGERELPAWMLQRETVPPPKKRSKTDAVSDVAVEREKAKSPKTVTAKDGESGSSDDSAKRKKRKKLAKKMKKKQKKKEKKALKAKQNAEKTNGQGDLNGKEHDESSSSSSSVSDSDSDNEGDAQASPKAKAPALQRKRSKTKIGSVEDEVALRARQRERRYSV